MVLKNTVNGDKIPICRVEDQEITLVNPDLPVRIRLPVGEPTWRSLPEIRAAERQCLLLSLALLSRHESEMFVTIESEKNTTNYLQSNYEREQRALAVPPSVTARSSSDTGKKHADETDKISGHSLSRSRVSADARSMPAMVHLSEERRSTKQKLSTHQSSPKIARPSPLSHPASDRLYKEDEKRSMSSGHHRLERLPSVPPSTAIQPHRLSRREKPTSSSSSANSSSHRTRINMN